MLRTTTLLLLVAVMCAPAHALFVENQARLAFEVAADPEMWLEGYCEALSGEELRYPCHRSDNMDALVIRATNGTMAAEWLTAPVPVGYAGQCATFLWVCGIDRNETGHGFQLFVNDDHRFSLQTADERIFSLSDGGWRLAFVSMRTGWGGQLGYMALTVPTADLTPGTPLTLRLAGDADDSQAWVMVHRYTDALAHLLAEETRGVYDIISLIQYDEANVRLLAPPDRARATIAIRSGRQVLASAPLEPADGFSEATLVLDRDQQASLGRRFYALIDGRRAQAVTTPNFGKQRTRGFLDEGRRFTGYVFSPGDLPRFIWERPAMVRNQVGDLELTTTFYNADFKPVERAEEPGRYGAVVEAVLADDYLIRRYATLYCCPQSWSWRDRMDVISQPFEPLGVAPYVWHAHQSAIKDFQGGALLSRLNEHRNSGIFWAGMSELTADMPPENPRANVWYANRQWWVHLKCKLSGAEGRYPPLARPVKLDAPLDNTLREGDPASVGYTPESLDAIREVCHEWAEAADVPLAILIARHGVICIHEAFGAKADGSPMDAQTPTWMASITKMLCATLVMQFVDQGLIDLDEPIGTYLEEFDRPKSPPITMRRLMTHTAGIAGGGGWGGDWGAHTESAHGQFIPFLRVADRQQYSGTGYAIAGKVLERISGIAVPYLYQRMMVEPLGLEHTIVAGTAGDCNSVPADMARVGQMLLNRGSYGHWRFMSEDTFDAMMPVSIGRLLPGAEEGMWGSTHWGIGTTVGYGPGMSGRSFRHGTASGAMLMMDPEHDIVIALCRDTKGPDYNDFRERFMQAVTAPLVPPSESAGQ